MIKRYLSVFRNHVILILICLILTVVSSRTNGKLSTYTSVFTGLLLIYAAIVFTIWIIKTPSKRNKNEGI